MAWFRVIITEISGKQRKGVRWEYTDDVNAYAAYAKGRAIEKLNKDFKDIEVVILPEGHPNLIEHQKLRRKYYEDLWVLQGKRTGKEKYGDRILRDKQ